MQTTSVCWQKFDFLVSYGIQPDLRVLDKIMLVRTSDSLLRNIEFLIYFKSIIQQTRFTLVMCVRLAKTSIWAQIANLKIDAR